MAIVFVCSCQFFLAIDKASNLCVTELDAAFEGEREAFKAFFGHKDVTVPMAPVGGHLGAGAGYNASAVIEPRMWRCAWKNALYADIVAQVGQLRLDILMLWFALAGSDGKPDAIFAKFEDSSSFKSVANDLHTTLEDAHTLVIGLLEHE